MTTQVIKHPEKTLRDIEANNLLASLSHAQLMAGLNRANDQLALLDALDFDPTGDDFDGPFPPSKNYEKWKCRSDDDLRQKLHSAKSDVERELHNRAALSEWEGKP